MAQRGSRITAQWSGGPSFAGDHDLRKRLLRKTCAGEGDASVIYKIALLISRGPLLTVRLRFYSPTWKFLLAGLFLVPQFPSRRSARAPWSSTSNATSLLRTTCSIRRRTTPSGAATSSSVRIVLSLQALPEPPDARLACKSLTAFALSVLLSRCIVRTHSVIRACASLTMAQSSTRLRPHARHASLFSVGCGPTSGRAIRRLQSDFMHSLVPPTLTRRSL